MNKWEDEGYTSGDNLPEGILVTEERLGTPDTEQLEREYEKGFNERFGFGIWDSRATDKETMLRTHRDEGIFSTDVLNYGKNFIRNLLTSRDTYWKEKEKDAYKKGYAECEKEYGVGEEYGLGEGY